MIKEILTKQIHFSLYSILTAPVTIMLAVFFFLAGAGFYYVKKQEVEGVVKSAEKQQETPEKAKPAPKSFEVKKPVVIEETTVPEKRINPTPVIDLTPKGVTTPPPPAKVLVYLTSSGKTVSCKLEYADAVKSADAQYKIEKDKYVPCLEKLFSDWSDCIAPCYDYPPGELRETCKNRCDNFEDTDKLVCDSPYTKAKNGFDSVINGNCTNL
jgi:hypothetical protein